MIREIAATVPSPRATIIKVSLRKALVAASGSTRKQLADRPSLWD